MTKEITKTSYSSPRLVEFGSVRNLTGGSGTMMMDGTITMVQV
ncbi:MAG: lasso RiPP family leader peptide-containing protein [Erythrobacter sp.]